MHPLLKALNDEFDDSCSVDSDAETIVAFTLDSTPAQAFDTINPISLDTCTPATTREEKEVDETVIQVNIFLNGLGLPFLILFACK